MRRRRNGSASCPICGDDLVGWARSRRWLRHFAVHLEPVRRGPAGSAAIELRCGCPDAVWPSTPGLFAEVRRHLWEAHDFSIMGCGRRGIPAGERAQALATPDGYRRRRPNTRSER